MTWQGWLLALSPALPIALSRLYRRPAARRIGLWLALPHGVLFAIAAWLARDCTGDDLAYIACTRTPLRAANAVGDTVLVAALVWPLVLLLALALPAWLGLRQRALAKRRPAP